MYVNTLIHLGKVSDGLVEDDDAASSSLSGTTSILSSPFIPHQSNDTQSIISTDSLSEKDPYEIGLGPPKLSRYSTADTHSIGSTETTSEMGRYDIVDTQSMGSIGSTSEIDLFELGPGGSPTFSSTRNIASQCRKPTPMIRTNSQSLPNLTLLPMTNSVIEIEESTDDDVITQRKENHQGSVIHT